MATHKHCIFCGEEVPVPRPTNWNLACDSPLNTMTPDTVGKRYHAVIVGSAKNETPATQGFTLSVSEDAPATPQMSLKVVRGKLRFLLDTCWHDDVSARAQEWLSEVEAELRAAEPAAQPAAILNLSAVDCPLCDAKPGEPHVNLPAESTEAPQS